MVASPLPAETVRLVGADGIPNDTATDSLAAPTPTLFTARKRILYVIGLFNPGIATGELASKGLRDVHVVPLSNEYS